jgi:hypothetical protein
MGLCGINGCGKTTDTMLYRFRVNKNEILFNVWVCEECYIVEEE